MSGEAETAGRAELAALAGALRPELHRYCARLMGSVIEGEDVVQDVFARAVEALAEGGETPPLRAWLFRIAHNRALDLLRRRAVRAAEPIEAAEHVADDIEDAAEGLVRREAVALAVGRFAEIPTSQRSAVILKDVLDLSLVEIADALDLSVDAVKALLARGRARLREIAARPAPQAAPRPASANVARYVALFNGRDWDGLRAMLADDVRLVQSTHPPRVGAADVGLFFSIYARVGVVRLAPAWLDGREAIVVHDAGEPPYLMWLQWRGDRIASIRDTRHARYVMEAAEPVLCLAPG